MQQSFTRIHHQGIKVDGQDIPKSMLDNIAERFIVVMETKDSHRYAQNENSQTLICSSIDFFFFIVSQSIFFLFTFETLAYSLLQASSD